MNEKDIEPPDKLVDKTIAMLETMRDKTVEHSEKIRSLTAKVSHRLCPNDGDPHYLDLEETIKASWGKEGVEYRFKLCPKCTEINSQQYLLKRGVPKKLLCATIQNWTTRTDGDREIQSTVEKYIKNPKGFIILQGDVGLGKTHLAVAILKEVGKGLMLTQNQLLLMLRETYRNEKAIDPVKMCKEVNLLVLDELGVSAGGRDEFPALYEVINHRDGSEAPTVFTTNVSPENFEEVFGVRIADRLGAGTFCQLQGTSWRKPN